MPFLSFVDLLCPCPEKTVHMRRRCIGILSAYCLAREGGERCGLDIVVIKAMYRINKAE